ncbi:MAG: SurA N-terminal domain-containing protein [Akkermansia sp.]|nr:SurA N-terminal domain-containing protein [Akkermansia sp.]
MKYISRSVALLLAIFCLCPSEAGAQGRKSAQPKTPRIVNRVAATVNGRPITSSEVRSRLAPYVRELTMLYPRQGPRFNAELVKAKKDVLNELIERELVLCEFETGGLMIPEGAVNEEISRRTLVQFNGSRDALLDNLRKSGMSFGEYRNSVRRELTVMAMRSSRYERGIPPTPDEIQAEYQATKADYRDMTQDSICYDKIFIPAMNPDDPNVTPEMQFALAEQVFKAIQSGEISFEDAAREYSKDMHAEDGGKWPYIKRKDLAVEFANIVFALPKGKLMGPLVDRMGFTIVRVTGKRQAAAPSLNAPGVKERVDESVRRKNNEKRYRAWVERLRERAVIRTYI